MPNVVSIFEIYKIHVEIALTFFFTFIIVYVSAATDYKVPMDVALAPWVLWAIKKLFDILTFSV